MKVKVDNITEEGLDCSQNIPAPCWDLNGDYVKCVASLHIDCNFKRINGQIIAAGLTQVVQEIKCSRCLEIVKKRREFNFNLVYNRTNLGQFLDIDSRLREEILLNWPMKPLCRPDCKGICPNCGKNLNIDKCICSKPR